MVGLLRAFWAAFDSVESPEQRGMRLLRAHLTPAQRQSLLAWQRATTISAGRARRARIILLVAEGMPIKDIAATVGISRRFVYKWVQRFREHGMEGLADKAGRHSRRVPRPAAQAESPRMSA